MMFNATFNNISLISWRSDLLVDIRVPGEKCRAATSHWQTLSHNVTLSTPHNELTTLNATTIRSQQPPV
jgi:hypothetical protein